MEIEYTEVVREGMKAWWNCGMEVADFGEALE